MIYQHMSGNLSVCCRHYEMLKIIQAETEDQINATRSIFREYEVSLELDLCFQGFEAEVAGLPGRYIKPTGRLFLAYSDEKLAGCVAFRKLEDGVCEMKRLFVRDAFRGQNIGIQLIKKVIADAVEAGYKAVKLDTEANKMGKAIGLYESVGFRPIEPYYENPRDNVLFMELTL